MTREKIRFVEKMHLLPRSVRTLARMIGLILAALQLASPLPPPKILWIQTLPVAADEFSTVMLPNGSGMLHIEAHVKNAERVYFWVNFLDGLEENRQLIYEDLNGSDGWAVEFPYDKEKGFSYQLIALVTGANRGIGYELVK
ncbi:hypothetical protein [Paenibacillus sp. Soil787]|uniref:hypothetical protein n=1 Tax=Paenibacillus sp. Soil787 TaxID=1736411 RepID=UPI000701F2BB|nr:hypothetical protein [Paenibacillus sp. Soil787]KRF43542.1 hypothetical protein ASG93_01040 [Paenibacillus sp. Soil787]